MNRKFIKENKTLLREFLGALIKSCWNKEKIDRI